MRNQNKVRKTNNYFPKIFSIKKWLINWFLEFFGLLKMVCCFHRYSFQAIKTQVLFFFIHDVIFPIARVAFGGGKNYSFCQSFFETHSSTSLIIIPLPFPLKTKIMMRCRDFGLYSEIYLKNVYSKEVLKRGMNVIDAGANIGVYTVLAAEKVGKNGKVITVEPEPKNYKQLIENINLNGFKNVIPKNIALADHEGFKKLYLSSSFVGHSLILREDKDSYIEVLVKTIDKLVEELDIKKIDIIKIDTEGTEISVLRGAEKTLKNNPNMRIIVATEDYPSQVKEVSQFLKKRGFKTKVSYNNFVMTI